MELAARTLVKLGQLPASKGADSFEYEIKKAFEFISEDRNDVDIPEICLNCSCFQKLSLSPFLGQTTRLSYFTP